MVVLHIALRIAKTAPDAGSPFSLLARAGTGKGFINIHILHHAAEEQIYGVAIMEELRRHGYDVSPGTLYPVLHELEEARYLRRVDRVVGGKVRKYYVITSQG